MTSKKLRIEAVLCASGAVAIIGLLFFTLSV